LCLKGEMAETGGVWCAHSIMSTSKVGWDAGAVALVYWVRAWPEEDGGGRESAGVCVVGGWQKGATGHPKQGKNPGEKKGRGGTRNRHNVKAQSDKKSEQKREKGVLKSRGGAVWEGGTVRGGKVVAGLGRSKRGRGDHRVVGQHMY